jgi:hypothetical protein
MNVWHCLKNNGVPLPILGFLSDLSEVFDPCQGIRYKYGSNKVCGSVLRPGPAVW